MLPDELKTTKRIPGKSMPDSVLFGGANSRLGFNAETRKIAKIMVLVRGLRAGFNCYVVSGARA